MRLKLLIGTLVFLIIVNLATIGSYVYFQMRQVDPRPEDFRRPPFTRRGDMPPLHLGKEQRGQLMELMREFHTETRELLTNINQLENELIELLLSDPVEEERVNEKIEEIAELRLEISRKAVQKMVNAKKYLTPEQQKHFYNMLLRVRPQRPGMRAPFQERDRFPGPGNRRF